MFLGELGWMCGKVRERIEVGEEDYGMLLDMQRCCFMVNFRIEV
jgi:hypothetical protein